MKWTSIWVLPVLVSMVLTACAPSGTGEAPRGSGQAAAPAEAQQAARTLVVLGRTEPANLATKIADPGSNATTTGIKEMFNAYIMIIDERKAPHPYQVEALPQLNTDTWRVFPDGRMETTYRLKPNQTWHDGAPLTAEDFVFTWQVYANTELGFKITPQNYIDEIAALDDRTFVIRWKRTFPDADALSTNDMPALPRHILEPVFRRESSEGFMAHPWWTREHVGTGPYKLDRWVPGASIEASAFDNYVFGKPKIERVRAIWTSDPNTAVANLLSESAHITVDAAVAFPQGVILKREWGPRNGGAILMTPSEIRFIFPQHRADMANPPAVRDLRVRKALAYAIDRQALNDALLEGEGQLADTVLPPELVTPAVERAVTRYTYDLRRTEQFMGEAGFTKGADGFYTGPGGRLSMEVRTIAGGQEEQEMAILTDGFRRAGYDASSFVLPAAQSNDGQTLARYPALFTGKSNLNDFDGGLDKMLTRKTPSPENRWTGSALSGYSNPEFDRLYNILETALDRNERDDAVIQMSRIISEELPVIITYQNFEVVAHNAMLRGTRQGIRGSAWIHEWQWR